MCPGTSQRWSESLWPFMSHLGNPAPALTAAKSSHKAHDWTSYMSSVHCCQADYQRVKCHVGTHKLHSPLKKCLLDILWKVIAADKTSNLKIAGKNSLCLSYAFRIAINIVSVLFLDWFYNDHISVEALLIFELHRRICRVTCCWV